MTNPSDTVTGVHYRKPRAGERTRGTVDAMQTKFAVCVQNIDPSNFLQQLQANVDELPDAAGADAAFIALFGEDGSEIETVLASGSGFAQCKPEQLAGEKLEDWTWLRNRLGHLRVVEVADTLSGPQAARDDLERLIRVLDRVDEKGMRIDVLYFDAYSAHSSVLEDFSPAHPASRRQVYETQNACFAEVRRRGIMPGAELARFWCLGMVLSVIPTCAINVLSGRLLLFVGLGVMGLTAQFIVSLVERAGWLPVHRAWRSLARILCFLLVGLHAVLPTILLPVMVRVPDAFQTVIAQVTDIGPLPEAPAQDAVIVNAPSPFHFIYLPGLRFVRNQPIPGHIRILAPGYFSVAITRLDLHTLLVRPEHGYLLPPGVLRGKRQATLPPLHVVYMYQHLSKFFRSDSFPMTLGQQIELTGMSVEVVSVTSDGRPLEAQIRFALSLEDSSMRWMQWDWEKGGYAPFVPPAVGKTVWISGPF